MKFNSYHKKIGAFLIVILIVKGRTDNSLLHKSFENFIDL